MDYRDILKVAKPNIGKRVKRKEKSKQLDALFSPKNNLPVFMLPICKRKEIPENLVNGDDVIEKSSDKNENFDSTKTKSDENNISMFSESQSLPKYRKSSKKSSVYQDKTIDFSKYVVISTTNYK